MTSRDYEGQGRDPDMFGLSGTVSRLLSAHVLLSQHSVNI